MVRLTSRQLVRYAQTNTAYTGSTIYAGVTFDDDEKTKGIISAQTKSAKGEFKVVAATTHQPNGLAADWDNNILYFSDEGFAFDR